MTTLRTAAQQALEALEKYRHMMFVEAGCRFGEGDYAITALRAALAQPDQRPVAWTYQNSYTNQEYLVWKKGTGGRNWTPLYTTPPQRKPLSLTDLQEALVLTNLIDRDAIEDPDEYDQGSTLAQIDELHRSITELSNPR